MDVSLDIRCLPEVFFLNKHSKQNGFTASKEQILGKNSICQCKKKTKPAVIIFFIKNPAALLTGMETWNWALRLLTFLQK